MIGSASLGTTAAVPKRARARGFLRGRQGALVWLCILPGILVYLAFSIVPALGTLGISLTNYSGVPGLPVAFTGLENYIQILGDSYSGIFSSLFTTLVFCAAVTTFQNLGGLGLATLFRNRFPGVGLFRAVVFMPVVLGVTIIGLLWLLMFNPSGGPAASVVGLWHSSSAFFGSNTWALPLVIFVQIWTNLGFTTVVYMAAMDTVPKEMYESASLDGAGRWNLFRLITIRMIASAVTVNVLLAVVGSLNTYDTIYVLTGGAANTMTLGMLMFNTAFESSSDLGLGAAISMMMFVLTLIIALPLQAWLRRREVAA